MTDTPTPEGMELIDAMAEHPTLDEFFTRNPAKLSDADLDWFVEMECQRRADFITKDSGA